MMFNTFMLLGLIVIATPFIILSAMILSSLLIAIFGGE